VETLVAVGTDEEEPPVVRGIGMTVLPEVEAEKEVEVGPVNDGELAEAV